MNCNELVYVMVQWRACVVTMMNLWALIPTENLIYNQTVLFIQGKP
jgi:hypothetical protein